MCKKNDKSKSGPVDTVKPLVETKGHVTACKNGPYPWVPANCQEVDGKYYYGINWRDCDGGWTGKAMSGQKLFHPADPGKTAVLI